jgi:DNA-binding Lrp family transcriptional regulator
MPVLHPVTDDYKDFTEAELDGLREDLRRYGLKVPVVIWQDQVVDGRHRVRLCKELGIELRYDDITKACPAEADMRAHVASLNQHRRSRTAPLTNAEKRARLAAELKKDPKRSDRAIAKEAGVTQPVAWEARKKLEREGVIESITPAERISKSGKKGHGQHREIVRGIRGAAPADQRAGWRVGLTPDEQRAIVAKVKVPGERALLNDLALDVRQVIADNLSKCSRHLEARERQKQTGRGFETVPVFNPLWYAAHLDPQTIRMMITHRVEKRADILAAAAAASDFHRYSVVSGLITPTQVKTMRGKYPHLFDREPPSILHAHLGTVDDEETKALRDFASILVNSFRTIDRGPESIRASLQKVCACIRHCTDARSWDERLWALAEAIAEDSKRQPVDRSNVVNLK